MLNILDRLDKKYADYLDIQMNEAAIAEAARREKIETEGIRIGNLLVFALVQLEKGEVSEGGIKDVDSSFTKTPNGYELRSLSLSSAIDAIIDENVVNIKDVLKVAAEFFSNNLHKEYGLLYNHGVVTILTAK